MLGPISRRPSSDSEPDYRRALNDLVLTISEIETELIDASKNLRAEYAQDALEALAQRFEEISLDFVRYTREKRNQYYLVLDRSTIRMQSARSVINSMKETAKLFERYARKPRTYSRVECRLRIKAALIDLGDLKSYCTPKR